MCDKKTTEAGGLLLRCDMCADAFCDKHMPEGLDIVGENELFLALGQTHPTTACFVTCSDECK